MKKIKWIICCVFILIVQTSFSQTVSKSTVSTKDSNINVPSIKIDHETHDFGTIPQGQPVKCFFTITNISETSLLLNEITTPCGCTTPVWQKGISLKKNESTKVEVFYNAAALGEFNKMLTIYYNDAYMKDVSIRGVVK